MRDRRRTRGRTANTVLNDGLIFAALTSEDPTLNAVYSVGSPTATYTRASEATYRDINGDLQIAASGTPRLDYDSSGNFLGYMAEPAITNKCTNHNANPDAGLTNLTKAGDAASTMTRVDASTELAAAGLDKVCTDGNAVELDNTSGVAAAQIIVGGTTTNTNAHSLSAYVLKVSGAGQTDIRTQNGAGAVAFTNTGFEKVESDGFIPTAVGDQFALQCAAGTKAWIVLNHLEELIVSTSTVVVAGSAAIRATDALAYPYTSNHSQTAGTCLITIKNGFDGADQGNNNRGIISSGAGSLLFTGFQATQYKSADGTGVASVSPPGAEVKGDEYVLAFTWATGGDLRVGVSKNGGAWVFDASSISYDGAYPVGASIEIRKTTDLPAWVKGFRIYNKAFTTAEIELYF